MNDISLIVPLVLLVSFVVAYFWHKSGKKTPDFF
jgi:hypothetical protein